MKHYTKETHQLKPTGTCLLEIARFLSRFAHCESWNMIMSMNEGWNFSKRVLKHGSCWGIL
jgi:hypothetical protein